MAAAQLAYTLPAVKNYLSHIAGSWGIILTLAVKTTSHTTVAARDAGARLCTRFAERLRVWRHTRNLLLKKVAGDLGVSVSVLSQWENGHRYPTLRNLQRLSQLIGLPVCCLLYEGKGECPHHAAHQAARNAGASPEP